ncbi:MAG: prepilin-type N-terminal cleavage/methylation domain-containing protein [Longimicrobiales bacterium]|nr:prepilin-type N-terminal cleavage/methylation domain-containing protein [Longimicrobiales bacterium]
MRLGDRRGVTLIELMIVVLIIATIAGIAIPNMQRALLRARAVDAMADLNAIRVALLNYQAEEDVWPADENRGVIPAGLEVYLPEGFSFTRDEYVLDYENHTGGAGFVGMSVRTDDEELGLMLFELLGNNTFLQGTDGYAWVIEWTS